MIDPFLWTTFATGMKKCLSQPLMNYSVTSWFGETFGACYNFPETTLTWLHLFFTLHERSRIFSCVMLNSQHHFQKCMRFSCSCSPVKCTSVDQLKTEWCLIFVVVCFLIFFSQTSLWNVYSCHGQLYKQKNLILSQAPEKEQNIHV